MQWRSEEDQKRYHKEALLKNRILLNSGAYRLEIARAGRIILLSASNPWLFCVYHTAEPGVRLGEVMKP